MLHHGLCRSGSASGVHLFLQILECHSGAMYPRLFPRPDVNLGEQKGDIFSTQKWEVIM